MLPLVCMPVHMHILSLPHANLSSCSRAVPHRFRCVGVEGLNEHTDLISHGSYDRQHKTAGFFVVLALPGHVGGPFMASCPAENTRPGRFTLVVLHGVLLDFSMDRLFVLMTCM